MTNNQIAFDAVWSWFVLDKHEKSVGSNGGSCTYYDEETKNKCAVGVLLSPTTLEVLKARRALCKGLSKLYEYRVEAVMNDLDGIDPILLMELQATHDLADKHNFSEEMEKGLRRIAAGYGLTIPRFLSREPSFEETKRESVYNREAICCP